MDTFANTSACETSGPEGVEPSHHETIKWEPSAGLVSAATCGELKAAKTETPPELRRGWMQGTTSTSPRRGWRDFFS